MKLLLAMLPTILLTAYSQLIIEVARYNPCGERWGSASLSARACHYLSDPYVISAFAFSLLGGIAWLYVAEKYPVSIAFPTYVGLLFAVVTVGSALLLKETISAQHLMGLVLILVGVVVVSRAV